MKKVFTVLVLALLSTSAWSASFNNGLSGDTKKLEKITKMLGETNLADCTVNPTNRDEAQSGDGNLTRTDSSSSNR